MFDRINGRAEMRTPAILSAGAHVFALIAMIVNFNFFSRTPIEPEPVMVDFEMVAKHAAAPTIGNPPPQPKDAKIAPETTKAPPPKTAEPPPVPETPKPQVEEAKPEPPKVVEQPKPKPEPPKPVEDKIAMKPKEPEPPKIEKPPEPPKVEPKPEVKKVEPPKPAPPKPKPPKPNVDNLVDSILKNQDSKTKVQTPEQQPKPMKEITRQAPAAPNFAAVVTASESQAVIQKIRPCWNNPTVGAKEEVIPTFVVTMNKDGTPVKAELQNGRSDPLFRAAADAAYRAIMNPRCHPWPLPPEKYEHGWRTITFDFNPRDY